MSTGADPKSRPNSVEFETEYERIFGKKEIQRGKWVWDEAQMKLVRAEDYIPPERAVDAPIMVDRFYEGQVTPDGVDIGSRRKHRQYMRDNGLTTSDDFTETWKKAAAVRERSRTEGAPDSARREQVGRAMYELEKRRK